MAPPNDEHERSIPLLDRESSTLDPRVPARRAQPTSPIRFVLATAVLVLAGLGAFYAWTHGRPAYHMYSKHLKAWNPHSKQVYFPNGTVADETELVRALFGRELDGGVDSFDLVATIYFKKHDYGDGRRLRGPQSGWDPDNSQNKTVNANVTATATEVVARAIRSGSVHMSSSGRVTYIHDDGEDWTPPPEPEWQRVFSEPVIRGLKVSQSSNAVVNVVLPASIV